MFKFIGKLTLKFYLASNYNLLLHIQYSEIYKLLNYCLIHGLEPNQRTLEADSQANGNKLQMVQTMRVDELLIT